jgi:uncharacterized phage protein (TIGR01671 family)
MQGLRPDEYYVKHGSGHWIYTGEIQYMYYPACADLPTKYEVEETICEYTGLNDKNGREIFKNDIVECRSRKDGYEKYKVIGASRMRVLE